MGNMIIRSVRETDSASVRALCAAALWLEPDAADLPAVLHQAPVALAAEVAGAVVAVGYGSVRDLPASAVTSIGIGGAAAASTGLIGHVDLLAVAPAHQGNGVGKALLAALEDALAGLGATEIRLGGNSPVYLWPGVDPRYTAATCLADQAGYHRQRDGVNLIVDLDAISLDTGAVERTLAAGGISVRRAETDEAQAIYDWLLQTPYGASSWPAEARAAVASESASCHVAVTQEGYLGFACQGVNRGDTFGPMATLPTNQRSGIGTVLLIRCLADIKAAGHASAQIGWAGPVRYYGRAVGARIDRVFWIYRKALADGPSA
jgi:GNAT superfamily N-acetyltransferase